MALASALLAAMPALAAGSRIADVRVGQHGAYDRIVVELESWVAVRWSSEAGADVFDLDARPLLRRQLFSTGRRRVGQMTLVASERGARLRLEPKPRRVRAFLLSEPARLVIDVTDPGPGAFEPPARTVALHREETPAAQAAAPPEPPAGEAPPAVAQSAALPAQTAASPELAPAPLEASDAEQDVAAAEPASLAQSVPSRLGSRALLVPLLAGMGLLLLAAGGLALASAQRRPGRRAALAPAGVDPAFDLGSEPLAADRLDLLEKRLDEEVRARLELEEQLVQAREELGGLRDHLSRLRRTPDAAP
jgi:hypothetical protein